MSAPEPDLPPTLCEGGCGRQIRTRYVRDWCGDCFGVLIRSGRGWPKSPLRELESADVPR